MDLEPAERNPAELRRTAFTLIAIMIVGAAFVLYAYKKHEQSSDPNRPPITAKITRNLATKNQQDEFASMSTFEGKVWFAAPFCISQLDENKHAIAAMKELDARYKDRKDVHFVLLSIEGVDQGVTPVQLAEAAQQLDIDNSRWSLLTSNDTNKQRGYIKDQLRLGLVSERLPGDPKGKWKFPSQISLIDREMHVRQRYDFKQATEAQAEMEKNVAKHPELKEEENIDLYLRAVPLLREKMFANTDYVLNETSTGK
jgi:hypothetical protein